MKSVSDQDFKRHYASHLKHLRLKGLQPKTIEAYARAIRRIGGYFDHQIDDLSEEQLTDYFTDLLESHSWSAVKLDLYGLKFYYSHVLRKPWVAVDLIKPPKARRLPDIVTVAEAGQLFQATRVLSYRVFYFTLYSLGLRLGEGLRLQVGDLDAQRRRVHVRTAHVNVGFFLGAELPDPNGLLEGTGKFMRHVKLRPGHDIDAPALERLIERAYLDMKARMQAA
jgi:site-specific recombinase XerD